MSSRLGQSAPLVSITSPFYNAGPTLLDMIRSLLAQTYENWELLLLDDGSTDDGLEIARSVVDPRIRVFSNARNLGMAASLNRLTQVARGEYIGRMDADDMCAPTRIERQLAYLQEHPDVDVVGGSVLFLDRSGKPIGHWFAPAAHAEICREPLRKFDLLHGAILARRSWLERHGYDGSLRLGSDFELFVRTHEHSRFANVPEVLYWWRFEPSFTLKKQFVSRRMCARFLFGYCQKKGRVAAGCWHWALQYGKFVATVLLFATGQRGNLMALRYGRLTEEELATYGRQVTAVKNWPLALKAAQ